jgi:hypothetical protein
VKGSTKMNAPGSAVAKANCRLHTTAQDWTIGQLLRDHYRDARFRAIFLNQPLLDTWTVKLVLSSPESFKAFLNQCRTLPQFGRTQEIRLLSVLMDLDKQMGLAPPDFNARADGGIKSMHAGGSALALGLGDAAPITMSGEFYPDYITAFRAVYQRAWRLAHFEEFVYLPASLPEFVKHPEVLRAEIGPEVDLNAYLAENVALLNNFSDLKSATGLILIERTRLDLLLQRQGRYALLSEATVAEQRQMLAKLISELPDGMEAKVCDFEAARISPGAVVGEMLIFSAMGGYVVFENSRVRAVVMERCVAAAARSPTLADYLAYS